MFFYAYTLVSEGAPLTEVTGGNLGFSEHLEDVMKRFLILAAMLCGLTTIGSTSADAGWRYRGGGYYGGGYYSPYYGGGGYYRGGYGYSPYRSYYRGGWNRGYYGGRGYYGRGWGPRGGVYIGF